MTYRTNPKTGEKVSLLGYGGMRWPEITVKSEPQDNQDAAATAAENACPEPAENVDAADDGKNANPAAAAERKILDQEKINALIDRAIEGGVTYFDTSPTYCNDSSETAMGIALNRHPRKSYTIATKLSNFDPAVWPREASEAMYRNSFKALQVDHIDYYLLHAIGLGGMKNFSARFLDNGMLDFLVHERAAGRIGNLGFSYHGDPKTFEYMMSRHDEIHWDFAQIQMNYVDWKHANELNPDNMDAEYLYGELTGRGIPVVIMEPVQGGRLAKVPDHIAAKYRERRPGDSIASWGFRFAGSHEGVLTVLSGMTYMENLIDNLKSLSPLEPLQPDDYDFLEENARLMVRYPVVPCNACGYCMPCPGGLDIPGIFAKFNACVNEGREPSTEPGLEMAGQCLQCGQCMSKCPQTIRIPERMQQIDGLFRES